MFSSYYLLLFRSVPCVAFLDGIWMVMANESGTGVVAGDASIICLVINGMRRQFGEGSNGIPSLLPFFAIRIEFTLKIISASILSHFNMTTLSRVLLAWSALVRMPCSIGVL